MILLDLKDLMDSSHTRTVLYCKRLTLLCLLLLLFISMDGFTQGVKDLSPEEIKEKVYEWPDDIASAKKLYPLAVKAVNTFPQSPTTAWLSRYVARQTATYDLGISNDSAVQTMKWVHHKLAGIDSIRKYRTTVYQSEAVLRSRLYKYDSAFYYYKLAIKDSEMSLSACFDYEKIWFLHTLANNYNNLGYVMFMTTNNSDTPEARALISPQIVQTFLKADSIVKVIIHRTKDECYLFNMAKHNLANFYGHYNVNRQLSRQYFRESIAQAEQCKDTLHLGMIYNSLSLSTLSEKDTLHAIEAAKHSLKLLKGYKSVSTARIASFECNGLLSKLYFRINEYDSVLKYGYGCLNDSSFVKKPIEVSFVTSVIAEIYTNRKDYESAYRMLMVSRRYLSRITSEKQQRSITGTFKTESEAEILSRLNKIQNLINHSKTLDTFKLIAITLLITVLVIGIIFFASKYIRQWSNTETDQGKL